MAFADMFSELKLYSIGIVAENKKLMADNGTDYNRIVEVTPIEDSPMLNGEINSAMETASITSLDNQGGEYQVQSKTANSVEAEWLPLGSSNRFTAPDVRRGERVVLYRFSDSDKFFWTTLFDDIKLRKLETVVYAWSGTKVEGAEFSPDNYYFLMVSTHQGKIHLHTSKANGEFSSVDLQLNLKEGFFQMVDDTGHLFIVDFKERQIAFKNPDETSIEINRKNLTIRVPETYKLVAKNKIEEISEKIDISAGDSIGEKTKAFTLNASDSINEQTSSLNVSASGSANLKAGGAMKIDGMPTIISKAVQLK